jgi:predicted nucleic acid-binding protein
MAKLYFDTNAIVKYYIEEKGSEVVHQLTGLINGEFHSIVTSRISFVEFPKVLKKKFNLLQCDKQKIDRETYHRVRCFFNKYGKKMFAKIIDDGPYFAKKERTTYREIMDKYRLKSNDARHVASVLNYLYFFTGQSHPIIVTSDKRHVERAFESEGYRCFDPEKQTLKDLGKIMRNWPSTSRNSVASGIVTRIPLGGRIPEP